MSYELDNDGFFEALLARKRKVTTMTPDSEPQIATTGGAIPTTGHECLAGSGVHAFDATKQIQDAVTRYQRKVREKITRALTAAAMLAAGIGGGLPVGMAIKEATTVERTVEKVAKVPVPAPAPKPVPIKIACPRCGTAIIVLPPNTGQVGALPLGLEENFDEPSHATPGRIGNPDHPADPRPGVPVPALPKAPAAPPGSYYPVHSPGGTGTSLSGTQA